MIRMGDIGARVAQINATLRGTVERLAGATSVRLVPQPNERTDSAATNAQVLGYLGARNPGLLSPSGADIDRKVREAARAAWRPRMGLEGLAQIVGPVIARAIGARLRSGAYVTNNAETQRRKSGLPGGVDTRQLADSLDDATATIEGR